MPDNNKPEYKDYIGLIKGECWKRVEYNPYVEFDELMSYGRTAFDKAVETWDPEKGAFTTHLWWQLQDQLGRVQGCQQYHISLDDEEVMAIPDPVKNQPFAQVALLEGIRKLSLEAKEVIWLIFFAPSEIVDFTLETVKITRFSIMESMTSREKDRKTIYRVNQLFAEIKKMLRGL